MCYCWVHIGLEALFLFGASVIVFLSINKN